METIEALATEELSVRETVVEMACSKNEEKQDDDMVCSSCTKRNAAGTLFCSACQHTLRNVDPNLLKTAEGNFCNDDERLDALEGHALERENAIFEAVDLKKFR